jgi:sialic acid synthase SpsE
VQAGEAFTRANLWAKRPGTGAIPAERYEEILGRRARRDLGFDTHLTADDFD